MGNDNKNYAAEIDKMLMDMPEFVTDFIYNFGHTENYATKYEYLRDIRDFFQFIVGFLPQYCDKEIRQLTLSDLGDIKPLDINRYLTHLAGSGRKLKLSTIKRRRATLSSMYGFLVSNGKLEKNPVLATKTIKLPEKSLIYLTNKEQSILLNTVRYGTNLPEKTAKVHNKYANRDAAMFLLMLDTGLRVSEMLDTNISDYNLDEGSVIVTRKGGDIDTVYYSDECAMYLDSYFENQRKIIYMDDRDIPAFTTTSGNRLGVRAVEMLVKKYIKACLPDKADIISPHKLRSSFAMSFYEASDNDILLLQKKLNHKNIATTNIYAKASDKQMEETRCILQGKR